ncbi:MAG: ATP-binding protein [Burkholderiaceae bacterium]
MPVPPVSSSSPAPRRWLQRFDKLRVKLFLAIAGTNFVLVVVAYAIHAWSFDQGLVSYLNQSDETRLVPLINRLAEGYQQHGDWQWIRNDRQRWPELLREVLGVGRIGRRPPEGGEPAEGATGAAGRAPSDSESSAPASSAPQAMAVPPPPPLAPPDEAQRPTPPLTIDPRMLLFDADREVIIGPHERAAQAVLKPIVVDGRVVGHLGYVPRTQMLSSLEQIFLSQQSRRFGAIALGLLAAVLLNAALISHWLTRRLARLGDGAAALARGDYATRLPVLGHDELARLAGDFNHLAQALEAARRARQRWIADIAHELRTPLATLRAEIEAMQDGVRMLDQTGLASLAQEVAQLTRLVEDLRLLSLSDLGALTYHKEPVALDEIIEEGLTAARPAVADHRLQVDLDLQSGVRVLADESRLSQVVTNLLQNTLRYSEAPARLSLRLRESAGRATLIWDDSAPGVDEADLPRLTDRLFRVDASRARAHGGSGLGLAIVKAIVEAHGGALSASASPLGGLRWEIVLPSYRGEIAHG